MKKEEKRMIKGLKELANAGKFSVKEFSETLIKIAKACRREKPSEQRKRIELIPSKQVYTYIYYKDGKDEEHIGIFPFKIGNIITGEYETIKITVIGRKFCLCEIIELDNDYKSHDEVGDEVFRDMCYLNNRYSNTNEK